MIETLALILLLASEDATTNLRAILPPGERPAGQENPTDPLFDRKLVATDDAAFVSSAIESCRQGLVEARLAAQRLVKADLRAAAGKIARENDATCTELEKLAAARGWRIPDDHAQREEAVLVAAPARTAADFIITQIAFHEATIAQFRAQLDGDGDAALKRTLSTAVPRYQANLGLLLDLDI